jgi:hypothetical protein
MTVWMQYLIAFPLFCHGFVYVRIGSMLPSPVKRWNGNSWLLGAMTVVEGIQTHGGADPAGGTAGPF